MCSTAGGQRACVRQVQVRSAHRATELGIGVEIGVGVGIGVSVGLDSFACGSCLCVSCPTALLATLLTCFGGAHLNFHLL